jgi:hypothetical protein
MFAELLLIVNISTMHNIRYINRQQFISFFFAQMENGSPFGEGSEDAKSPRLAKSLGRRMRDEGLPRKKAKKVKGAENEADEVALKEIVIADVSNYAANLLQAATVELNHEDLEPRKTQFGFTARTAGTFGSQCVHDEYVFARHKSPIREARGALLQLLKMYAEEREVDVSECIAHLCFYKEKTQAGIDPHRDDEPIINQQHPIVAYQTRGSAMLHVWSGKPNGRPGACVEISEGQSYTMPAGFQENNFHAIIRRRQKHRESRLSFTFRVVNTK